MPTDLRCPVCGGPSFYEASACSTCYAKRQEYLRSKEGRPAGGASCPPEWEEQLSDKPGGVWEGGGGTRVIRKPIPEDNPSPGQENAIKSMEDP